MTRIIKWYVLAFTAALLAVGCASTVSDPPATSDGPAPVVATTTQAPVTAPPTTQPPPSTEAFALDDPFVIWVDVYAGDFGDQLGTAADYVDQAWDAEVGEDVGVCIDAVFWLEETTATEVVEAMPDGMMKFEAAAMWIAWLEFMDACIDGDWAAALLADNAMEDHAGRGLEAMSAEAARFGIDL